MAHKHAVRLAATAFTVAAALAIFFLAVNLRNSVLISRAALRLSTNPPAPEAALHDLDRAGFLDFGVQDDYFKASAYLQLGRRRQAVRAVREVVRKEPGNANARALLLELDPAAEPSPTAP